MSPASGFPGISLAQMFADLTYTKTGRATTCEDCEWLPGRMEDNWPEGMAQPEASVSGELR